MKTAASDNVQSLERALNLLEILAEYPDGCPLKQLSERAELSKSTVHRLLHTFVNLGYVYQEEETEKYRLGPKLLTLSNSLLENIDVRAVARPFLKELSETTGEVAQLSIRNQDMAVFIDKMENPNRTIRMYSQVGKSIPLYCSSSGKVLVAWLEEQKIRSIFGEGPFKRYTSHTITDPEALMAQLAEVRGQGFAVDWFEHEDSVFCISSPIFDSRNHVVAAVGIAGTILQINPGLFLTDCTEVNRTARAISEQLGCARYPAEFHPSLLAYPGL